MSDKYPPFYGAYHYVSPLGGPDDHVYNPVYDSELARSFDRSRTHPTDLHNDRLRYLSALEESKLRSLVKHREMVKELVDQLLKTFPEKEAVLRTGITIPEVEAKLSDSAVGCENLLRLSQERGVLIPVERRQDRFVFAELYQISVSGRAPVDFAGAICVASNYGAELLDPYIYLNAGYRGLDLDPDGQCWLAESPMMNQGFKFIGSHSRVEKITYAKHRIGGVRLQVIV